MADLTVLEPFADAMPLVGRPEALRDQADRDGYLLLRGLLPAGAVLALRGAILAELQAAGWCDVRGVCPPSTRACVEGDGPYMAVYDRIQRMEAFHRLALHPALLGMYGELFGEPPLAHPRNIARLVFPRNNTHATPPHQDFLHIRGTARTWTAWIPLGDCPLGAGGLALMAGSHAQTLLPTHAALGAGGAAVDTAALEHPWVGGDLAAGDVLTFHSHLIHQALPNLTTDRMRLSVDFRYQPASEPVAAGSLLPHFGRLSWAEIYAGWHSAAGQRYWEALPLQVV